MNSVNKSNTIAVDAARSLRRLYFLRAAFSVIWAILVSVSVKTNIAIASVLFVIYPAWDAFATYLDIKNNPQSELKTSQFVNLGISVVTTIGVAVALQHGVPEAVIVFGAWAIVTGIIQLILGLRRRKVLGGQWPMIISGGQSTLAGLVFISFISMAHKPTMGIGNLAGYAVFGAFYFLLAAIRLAKTVKGAEK